MTTNVLEKKSKTKLNTATNVLFGHFTDAKTIAILAVHTNVEVVINYHI